MHATSRESLSALRERFDSLTDEMATQSLRTLGAELSSVTGVLASERMLRRRLADPAASESSRSGLVDAVFGGKIGDPASRLLREAAAQRWSRSGDLLDAVELLARQSMLSAAEREGTLDETEDELFRFGRVLGSEDRLRELLGEVSVPAERRLGLLRDVLDGKVGRDTAELLDQAVRSPRGRSLDLVVDQLAGLAAARRERSVAQVTAAAPLSPEQEERLAQVLAQIYRKTISVQVEVDPEVWGGLVVRVGDEVIDGSTASKLARASQGLPA